MPARYEAMRDKFVGQGLGYDAAQTKAAKIFNATRKPGEPPLGSPDAYEKKKHPKKSDAAAIEAVGKMAKARGIKGFD